MASCEMCGKSGRLAKVKIEGATLDVCEYCASFGEVIKAPQFTQDPRLERKQPIVPQRKEKLQIIVADYGEKIKNARERTGLTQEEFSKKLNEKTSVMHKIESGQMRPSIELARKLESALRIQLVEEYDDRGEIPLASNQQKKDDGFTLGDFIKTRKK